MTAPEPTVAAQWREDAKNGAWKPSASDPIHDCEFIRLGFRAYGLEAPDKKWRITLSRLDFGDSNPSCLLEVHAEGHDAAFGNLNWFVLSHTIGTNGGTNFNQAVKRLSATLGDTGEVWERRLSYLIRMAKNANIGGGNGTFVSTGRLRLTEPPAYIFEGRLRAGRTVSVFGPGSAGKTTVVDGLIVSACSGREIIPGWAPTRQFPTLLLDWDEGFEEEAVRLGAIQNAYEVDLVAGYHYKRQTRPLHDIADEIGAYIANNAIELVIVSPMGRASRSFGENITGPVDEVYEILRTFGTTNILIDHVTGDNMKGGAQREFGSVRKRDNARGSYAVDVQSEEVGSRVLVLRNTKADALAPRQPDQAIRVEYDPPYPHGDSTYDGITFHSDVVQQSGYGTPGVAIGGTAMRIVIHDLLLTGHANVTEIATQTGYNTASVRTTLNRNPQWFGKLPSTDRWEALPRP